MNVLYVGHYRDGTGWGQAAIDYIGALTSVGINVAARPFKLNTNGGPVPDFVREAENRRFSTYDVVIQHTLPSHMDFCGNIPKNIAMYATETDGIDGGDWPQNINCLDEAWVFNLDSALVSSDSGVNIPIHVVPHAADVSRYAKSYNPLPVRDRLKDSFIFYFIGEFNKRKNIPALIRAFHTEFDVNEPVSLVIKTNIPGSPMTDYEKREQVVYELNKIKESMRLYPSIEQYKQEIVLVEHYSDEEVLRLHASCDCLVCPSFGEAWNIVAFDGMAMGKTPIVTSTGGFLSYIDEETGWLVNRRREPVQSMQHAGLPNMFTGRELWDSIDVVDLMRKMRFAYSMSDQRQRKATAGKKRAHDFSYEKVGARMKELLS